MLSKFLIAIGFLSLSFYAVSQKNEPTAYYDVNWKPCPSILARFVSYVTPTDSGHLRKDYYLSNSKPQMIGHFADSEEKVRHGQFIFYYADGKPSSIGQYLQNRRHGVCLSFHPNGMMSDSGYYNNGRIVGYAMGWHPNGYQKDSLFQRNDSIVVAVYWFDDGSPEMTGYFINGEMSGTWQFFYKGGGLAKKATYLAGKEVAAKYYDKNGEAMIEGLADRPAFFKGGGQGWKKYIEKKLYWPTGYKFNEGNQAAVAIKFTIDENGKVRDAYVDVPFHPEFDKIAFKAVAQSEGWQPAVHNNRAVKSTHRQLVTFSQTDN